MPSRSRRPRRPHPLFPPLTAVVALALALGPWPWPPALAGESGPTQVPSASENGAAQSRRHLLTRRPLRPEQAAARPSPGGPGGWWFGTAGVALALALCGWGSVAARRYLPTARGGAGPTPMRVVGRTSLSPRHTVYLLEVGGRVLIVGAGAQGAPSLLGELTDFDDLARFHPGGEPASTPSRFSRPAGGGS